MARCLGAFYVDVFHQYVAYAAFGTPVASFKGEELSPWAHGYDFATSAGDVRDMDVGVELVGVGAHFQAQNGACVVDGAAVEPDIACAQTFAAKRQCAMQIGAEHAVFHYYGIDPAVAVHLVGIDTFAAFNADSVVVGVEKTVADFHSRAYVEIDAVAAGGARRARRCCHAAVFDGQVAALIEMASPEG